MGLKRAGWLPYLYPALDTNVPSSGESAKAKQANRLSWLFGIVLGSSKMRTIPTALDVGSWDFLFDRFYHKTSARTG